MSISDCILLLQYFNHLQLIIVHVVTSYVSFKILNIILFFTQFVALIKRFFTWKCACFLYFKFLFPRKWQQCFPNILTQTLKVVFVVSFILFPSIWTPTGFLNLFVLPIFFYTCFLISQMVFIFTFLIYLYTFLLFNTDFPYTLFHFHPLPLAITTLLPVFISFLSLSLFFFALPLPSPCNTSQELSACYL